MTVKPKAQAKAPEIMSDSLLIVTALKNGFRRAGVTWSGVTEVSAFDFTAEQLDQLMTEPLLRVEVKGA